MALATLLLLLLPGDDGYQPAGRRDPFVRLDAAPLVTQRRCGVGLAGVRDAWRALLADSHGRSFVAAAGDRLCDGRVASVGAGVVQLDEDVSDPLATERTRTRRLLLHP